LVEWPHRLGFEPNYGHEVLADKISDEPGDHVHRAQFVSAALHSLEFLHVEEVAVEVATSYSVELVNQLSRIDLTVH
jgi:hypothetical protein